MCGWEEEDNDLFTVRLEESWDFICGVVGTAGRIKQVRDFICLKLIKDFLIG